MDEEESCVVSGGVGERSVERRRLVLMVTH